MIVAARQHLQQAGETYFEHLRFASLVGALLVAAGIACVVHAIIPALCRTSASGIVKLVSALMLNRSRTRATARAASGPLVFIGLLGLCTLSAALLIAGGLHVVSAALALLLAGVPAAYLLSNPDLEPVD